MSKYHPDDDDDGFPMAHLSQPNPPPDWRETLVGIIVLILIAATLRACHS